MSFSAICTRCGEQPKTLVERQHNARHSGVAMMQCTLTLRSPFTVSVAVLCTLMLVGRQCERIRQIFQTSRFSRACSCHRVPFGATSVVRVPKQCNHRRDYARSCGAVGYFSEHSLALIAPQHWISPVESLRLVTYWICHSGWSHLMGNLPTLLLLGPGLEARFGTWQLAGTIVASGLVVALCHCLISPDLGLHGLSGAVFFLLMLAGGSQMRTVVDHAGPRVEVPITYLMLACVWAGKEFASVSACQPLQVLREDGCTTTESAVRLRVFIGSDCRV
jgi:hypothetical protein